MIVASAYHFVVWLTRPGSDRISRKAHIGLGSAESRRQPGFLATFPRVPERSTQNMDLGGTPAVIRMYVSEVEDGAFVVGVFDLAQGMPFDFNLSVNGSAAAVDGRVENSRLTQFQGFDAAESLISAKGGFAKGLVVRAPSRVYQVQVVGPDNPPEGYERFKQSFQIVSS